MTAQGFTLFDTVIGRCGLAWGERGLIGVQLPDATPGAAWARLRCPWITRRGQSSSPQQTSR